MNKQEIKDLVLAKIAGQGTMVDVGGALPAILNAIVDLIPEGGGGSEPYIVQGTAIGLPEDYDGDNVITVAADEFARAKEAFLAGRIVFIPKIDSHAYIAIGYSVDIVKKDDVRVEGLALFNRSKNMVVADGVCVALVSR